MLIDIEKFSAFSARGEICVAVDMKSITDTNPNYINTIYPDICSRVWVLLALLHSAVSLHAKKMRKGSVQEIIESLFPTMKTFDIWYLYFLRRYRALVLYTALGLVASIGHGSVHWQNMTTLSFYIARK